MYVCIYVCSSLFICKYTMFDTAMGLLGLFPECLSVTGVNPDQVNVFIGRCRHQHRKHTGVWAGNPARSLLQSGWWDAGVTSVRLINAEYICRSGKLFLTSENIWTLWSRNRSGQLKSVWSAVCSSALTCRWFCGEVCELAMSFQACDVRERGWWCLFHTFRF